MERLVLLTNRRNRFPLDHGWRNRWGNFRSRRGTGSHRPSSDKHNQHNDVPCDAHHVPPTGVGLLFRPRPHQAQQACQHSSRRDQHNTGASEVDGGFSPNTTAENFRSTGAERWRKYPQRLPADQDERNGLSTWYRSPPAHFRQDCHAFKQFAHSLQDRSDSFLSRLGGFEETGSGTKLALLRSGELSPES